MFDDDSEINKPKESLKSCSEQAMACFIHSTVTQLPKLFNKKLQKHTHFLAIGCPHTGILGWDEVSPLGLDSRDFLVTPNSTPLLDWSCIHFDSTREGGRGVQPEKPSRSPWHLDGSGVVWRK